MKKILILCFCFLAIGICHGENIQEDLFTLWNKISEFEKKVPFFTKSKISIFFAFENKEVDGAFYGLLINDELVRTGNLEVKNIYYGKGFFVGDFPVRTGKNIIGIKIYKNNNEITKKFEIEIPEFRRISLEFLFSGTYPKVRITTRAWLVE